MYKIKENTRKIGKITNKLDFVNIDGYVMKSKSKYFMIDGEKITDIKIINDNLVHNIISEKVNKKYNRLIKELTNLLLSEDDDAEGSMNEILNRIEKFRQEIKFKYRSYLKNKELEKMARQLRIFQKEAKIKLEEINNYKHMNTIGRNR
ncbi:MAG: hypothetical protein IKO49_06500 [Bacilli bacterium]|nr:hypothetical protein [Bacilli bacterium]